MQAKPLLLLALLHCTPLLADDEFRVWTSTDGRTVEAAFGGLEGGNVKLRQRNGAVAPVPLTKLSGADQEFIKSQGAKPAAKPAFGAPAAGSAKLWPRTTGLEEAPKAVTVKEDNDAKEYVYQTTNFEFQCDTRLGADVVREFARMFEGTLAVNKALPLNFEPTPEAGREKFVARLFTSKDDYFKAGAIPGSAGVYMGGQRSIFVPLASLGVKMVGKRVALEPVSDNSTLIHEITHQMMNHWIPKLPTWYVEGSAEYIAAQKYHMGRFTLSGPGASLKKYMHDHKGVWEKNYTMWHIYHLMSIDSRTWAEAMTTVTTAMRNYNSANILTYYYYHVDDKGDAAHVIDWIKDIGAGTKRDEATQKHLIRGRSYKEIEKEVAKCMMKEGITLDFAGEASGTGADSK